MAQTGYTPIQLYYSTTASTAPIAGNLANGELAINITDGKLFYKDNANAIQVIGWKTVPTSAGGTGLTSYSQGDLVYYNSGTTLTALSKNTSATRYLSNTGTNNNPAWAQIDLTNGVTGTLPTANGGTNLTSFTANGVVYASSTSALATGSSFVFNGSNVGIGTSNPGAKLNIYHATLADLIIQGDATTSLTVARYSTNASQPTFSLSKYRGTLASPTTVATGDTLGTISYQGYGGTNLRTLGQISGLVDTYTSDSNISSFLIFSTSASGAATPTERMRITAAGDVQLSTAATKILNSSGRAILNQTGGILQVVQNSTVGSSSTTSTTAVDVTNLTVTITPSSTSSKILILSSARCAYTLVAATNVTMTQTLVRTATTLVTRGLAAGSGGGGLQATASLAIQYVDSPATTSATTYKIQHNVSSVLSTGTTDEGWIIAMEISG